MKNIENMQLYLIRLGEISLKGLNRRMFEKQLKANIKLKIHPHHSLIEREKGRIYLYVEDSCPEELVYNTLRTTFGVVGFSRALVCEKNFDRICETALKVLETEPFNSGSGTFKVECRRADKNFELNSYQIEARLGALVLERYPQMKVDVHKPEKILYVEIRDMAYLYSSPVKGPSGLPTGTAGKGLLLLSGGIDSPVAGYRMASRGLRLDALYFHAYPYTSEQALGKVKDLAMLLSGYNMGMNLFVVNFTKAELWIKDHSKEEEHTLMMRACMMKVANRIARKRGCQVLVTGEALGQVASQTLEAMCFTNSMSEIPVLRPLVGMDKQEIIDTARQIGTYETSILPYDDCCVIFSPKHPLVKPDVDTETRSFLDMDIDELLDKCVEEVEMFEFSYRV
ncbi:MAG: tRNA 4-thiouridine(8) synthase ThiI [Sphaerochaetaceae bacterium]|nr:tRNA 4-thiouridine(8) synthase ThiI [Sphaerochaetaceae bacterium]